MRRITVRLHPKQHEVLVALAQELGTDIAGALRALISGRERTGKLLDAFEETKVEILRAVTASREANTENLKRAVNHLTQLLGKEPK